MKLVIVGGGFAGVKMALELSNKPGFEVILISERQNFEYHGALYRSGTGRSPLEVVIPLRGIFENSKNVTLVHDKIIGLDKLKRRIVSETGNIYPYDKLILALGNTVNYFGMKNLDALTMSLDTIANTIALRNKLTELFKGSKPKIKIIVIGAGPAGVELAGEMKHYAGLVAEKYKVPLKKIVVDVIDGADHVLPTLLPAASKKAMRRLKKLGVNVRLNTQINSCEPGKVCLDSGELEADLIVWTAGSHAVSFYSQYPDIFEFEKGRIKVDQYLHAVDQQDIYVVGDNAATPYSGMAQTALHDAKFVARNLIREQSNQSPLWYRAQAPVYSVPIGPKWALLQTRKHVSSGYHAWLIRRRADLAIYRNFEPYKKAIKTWRKGNELAKF